MAFPTIPTAAAGRVVTGVQADTSGTRTFPSLTGLTKNSGDLLIAIIVGYQSSLTANIFGTWGGGFTEIRDIGVSSQHCVGIAYKFSNGSETGTFTVAQAGTVTGHAAMILLSIPGAHASTVPEVLAALATGTSSAADPGSLNPAGWDAEDTLWIAVRGCGETSTSGTFTGLGNPPTNYTNSAQTGISGDVVGGVEAGASFRQLNAASEDVGAGTCDVSNARNCATVIAVRPAAVELHSGSLTASGGGVLSGTRRKGARVTSTATGGGVAAFAAKTARSRTLTATGGGVATVVDTTARSAAMTATGGGVAAFAGEAASSSEEHDGALAATGGGVASFGAETDRAASLTGTGGGAASLAAQPDHPGSLAGTGAGTWATSAEAARYGAFLLSGGGVLASLASTDRVGSLAATGGGSATLVGSTGENHSGAIAATGGGVVSLNASTNRALALLATGGGVLSYEVATAHNGALTATGGGSLTLDQSAPEEEPVPIFTDINDDGTLPTWFDPETNRVQTAVRLLDVPDPLPELPADADIADVIAMLIELGVCTQAETP